MGADHDISIGPGLPFRLRLFFGVVPAVFAADFLTKLLVQRMMVPYGETVTLIENLARLRFIFNEGIAFGIRTGLTSGWVLIVLTAAVVVLLVGYFFMSVQENVIGLTAMALIAGGALGNLYDRVLHGKVVDFIELGWRELTWPVFNVADIAVTAGAVLLAIRLFQGEKGKEQASAIE